MADDKIPASTPAEPLQGGPGAEPTPPQPELVTVKYGGREFMVPKDAASAWQEREREFDQRFSKQGAELGELRKRATQPAPPVVREEPKEPDINTLWFENPQAAYQKIVADVETRVESRYRQDQAEKEFWSGFYRANDDLREDDWVVRGVLNEHMGALRDLPVREAQKKLADLTRGELLRIARKTRTPQDDRPQAMVEAATGERPQRQTAPQEEGHKSLSELLAARRRAKLGVKGA